MRTFTIATSRGSVINLEIDDTADELGLDDAVDTAQAIYRVAQWLDTTVDGVVTGEYLRDGRMVRIAVIETTEDDDAAASTHDAAIALRWVREGAE